MTDKELNPIPEGSLITEPMVAAYMEHFKCDRVIAIGGLLAWEQGKGQMDSRLVDLDISTGSTLFTALREASFKARAQQETELSLTKDNATGAELEQLSRDQAAAAAAEAETAASEGAADTESAEKEEGEASEEAAADADSEAEAASGADGEGSEEVEGDSVEADADEAEGEAQTQ